MPRKNDFKQHLCDFSGDWTYWKFLTDFYFSWYFTFNSAEICFCCFSYVKLYKTHQKAIFLSDQRSKKKISTAIRWLNCALEGWKHLENKVFAREKTFFSDLCFIENMIFFGRSENYQKITIFNKSKVVRKNELWVNWGI